MDVLKGLAALGYRRVSAARSMGPGAPWFERDSASPDKDQMTRNSLLQHKFQIATQIHGDAAVEKVIDEFIAGI
jgi:hypothetical protein